MGNDTSVEFYSSADPIDAESVEYKGFIFKGTTFNPKVKS